MFGFILSLAIAFLVFVIRKQIVISRIILTTGVFFIFVFLSSEFLSHYPKDEVIIYRETIKYSIVLYFMFLVNVIFMLMVNRVMCVIKSTDMNFKKLLFFYEIIYMSLYVLANILINYGVWLK